MTWETRDVLMILGAVVSAAVTIVAVRHQVATLTENTRTQAAALLERFKALEESRDKLGERLGKLERIVAVNAAVSKAYGTPALGTRLPPALQGPDDSGEHKG